MRKPLCVAAGIWAALAAAPVFAQAPPKPAPIVFFDIAGTDLKSQADFYQTVFGWSASPSGGLTAPVISPLPGQLRIEAGGHGPVAERMIYLGVPDVNAALERIKAHGGAVVFGRMVVPGVVILALFTDPAGNRMGVVEMDGDKPKVPPAR
jgi:predicted enzyme related to lactoylglutathione lyase